MLARCGIGKYVTMQTLRTPGSAGLRHNMPSNTKSVITRFAPSPTGFLHIGNVRTGLFAYLFARCYGGKFILRIEDTDKERSKKEYEDDIIHSLAWLGISYDEVYRQSERTDIYKRYLKKMLDEGSAYEAEENEGGTGKVVRFRNPNTVVAFHDIIRGDISVDTTELKDFVIAKDAETPLFHLAVVVDDFEMGITHIIRGEDHISNTPRQILIQRAIGAPEPVYAHLPLILAPDRSKLGKRNGALPVHAYEQEGYLPDALLNFLVLLGWNPGDEREIFTPEELIKEFDIAKVQKSGAVFNQEKLNWINKEHLRKMPAKDLRVLVAEHIGVSDDARIEKIAPIVLDRISKISDIEKMAEEGEWDYFFTAPEYDTGKLLWKDSAKEDIANNIDSAIKLLQSADFSSADTVKKALWDFAEERGRGAVLWPIRYALSGRDKSSDPFTIAAIIGKEEAISRLRIALSRLRARA